MQSAKRKVTGAAQALARVILGVQALHLGLCTLLFGQGAPRYTAELLKCSAYIEEVRTLVDARRGMQSWQEKGFRRGLLQLRATPGETGLAFESWYDSLSVEYTNPQGKVTPDTDGLIGGRWTGTMLPQGQASLTDRPFMPPELAQVSDLSDEMVDFFPPLATAGLAIGAAWSDSLGLEVERLRDSTGGGERLLRFRWRITSHGAETPAVIDTTVRLRQEIEDEGVMAWSPTRGPLGWRREIEVNTRVGASRRGGTPTEGRVTQLVTVRRITRPGACE